MEPSDKIIALTDRNQAARQRQLSDCRMLLCDLVCNWLNEVRAPILEELQNLAAGRSGAAEQRAYLNLRHDLQDHWRGLVEAVAARLSAPWRPAGGAAEGQNGQRLSLQLVDDAMLAEQIMIRELAARLSETCSQEMYGIERRVAVMLDSENPVVDEANPLGTHVLCQALNEAAGQLPCVQENADLRAVCMRRLEPHMHPAWPGIFAEINALLVKRGILPELKQSYRRKSSTRPASAGSETGGAAEFDGREMQALIQQLATAQVPAGGIPGGVSVPALPALKNQDFVSALQQVQQVDWSDLPAVTPPSANLVWQVRQSEAAAGVGHLDAATIDIVAMLFDFIFEDEELSAGVKALVGRLQIPVLKVALLDQDFFASREHPARYFLDDISGIALRWGGHIEVDDPFYLKLEELVTRIQHEFAEDVEVFSRAIDELEAFVDAREAEIEATMAAAAAAAAERERALEAARKAQEAARQKAADAVAPWLDKPIFPPIRDFFETHWQRVLERLALDQPDDEAAWQQALEFMDDLSWSISLKSRQQRNRLVSLLPKLLNAINLGLDRIEVPAPDRQPFMDMLFELHSANVKAATSAVDGVLPEPEARYIPAPQNEDEDTGELVVTRLVNDGVEVEEITLVGKLSPGEQSLRAKVMAMECGDWVEFRPEGTTPFRARLNWISPQKGLMLFVRDVSGKAVSMSPEALASQLRDGKVVFVETESLFERALHSVMQFLKKGGKPTPPAQKPDAESVLPVSG